jgi:hypothetical protein
MPVIMSGTPTAAPTCVAGPVQLVIYGVYPLQQQLNKDVTIRTAATYTSCSGSVLSTNLKYSWSVARTDGQSIPGCKSQSKDQTVFYIPKYTLAPGNYTFRVDVQRIDTVVAPVSRLVNVVVVSAGISANIAGGDVQSVRVGGFIALNAGSSADNDVEDSNAAATGLSFSWSCFQSRPMIYGNCSLMLAHDSTSSSIVYFAANSLSATVTEMVTVTVAKGNRFANKTITVNVVASSAALISISSMSPSGGKFVVSNKFAVTGKVSTQESCVASWNVSNSAGSFVITAGDGKLLSASKVSIGANVIGVELSFILAPFSLPEDVSLEFLLSCGAASASVTIITNSAPRSGYLTVSPTTGFAFETTFVLTASSWVDEDTPISYQFLVASDGLPLEVRRPLQTGSAMSALPAGSSVNDFNLLCLVRVFDSYGAMAVSSFNVTVKQIQPSLLTSVLTSQLTVNVTADVNGAKLAVALVTASLNVASCGDGGCSVEEISGRQGIRTSLLATLYAVSLTDVIDTISLMAMSTNLAAIMQTATEISDAGVVGAFSVVQSLLSVANASSVSLSEGSVASLLHTLNSVTLASIFLISVNGTKLSIVDTTSTVVSLVESCNSVILDSMLIGETSMTSTFDSFSTVLSRESINEENVTLTLPAAVGQAASSVTIPSAGSGDMKVSAIVTKAWAYGKNTSLISDAVSVSFANFYESPTTLSSATTLTSAVMDVIFMFQKNSGSMLSAVPSLYNFTRLCRYGEYSSHSYLCPDSGRTVAVNCTGALSVLTALCPGVVAATACASAAGNAVSCSVLGNTATNLTCKCAVGRWNRSGRRLGSGKSSMTGLTQIAVLADYVGEEFAATLETAATLNSAADLRKVLIVIVAFVVLWAAGFVTITSAAFRSKIDAPAHQAQKQSFERMKRYAQAARSPVAIGEYLTGYINEVFPSAFKDKPSLYCLFDELYRHHRYILLFSCSNDEKSDKNRVVTGVRLLTVQTMLMFLLAVFYDLQAPSDNGTCETFTTESTCLLKKSIIQVHTTYCQWLENPGSHQSACSYKEPSFDYLIILYVSVLISVATALVASPTDSLFAYLGAPTADIIKLNAVDAFTAKLMKRAKRASVSVSPLSAEPDTSAAKQQLGEVNFETRDFPESTRLAHALAVAATPALISKSQALMLRRIGCAATMKMKYDTHGNTENNGSSDDDNAGMSGSEDGTDNLSEGKLDSEVVSRRTIVGRVLFREDITVVKRFKELSRNIDVQRKALEENEVEEFDSSWGIDPTGEFVKRDLFTFTGYKRVDSAASIRNEMSDVESLSKNIGNSLKLATDQHIGLEILHLFVLDVLGRDTLAARIFKAKAAEDFFTVRVVTRRGKMLAWSGVVFLNLFFVYFTILKSFQKGSAWQRAFLIGTIVQIVVEVVFNETIECMWVNFMVPRLVSEEVNRAAFKMHLAVSQLCAPETVDSNYFLDAPAYLFVSTAVAKKFPNHLESMVVRAYQSHLPGMLADKWQFGPAARFNRSSMVRAATLMTAIFVSLQAAAASPFIIQRLVIRISQPWLLTGVIIAFAYLRTKPLLLSIVCFSTTLAAAGLVCYTMFRGRPRPKKVFADNRRNSHSMEVNSLDGDPGDRPVSAASIVMVDNEQSDWKPRKFSKVTFSLPECGRIVHSSEHAGSDGSVESVESVNVEDSEGPADYYSTVIREDSD